MPPSRPPDPPVVFGVAVLARSGQRATLRVEGELDLATAAPVRCLLEIHGLRGRHVTLDLRAVRFLDCAGLTVLVDAAAAARADRWALTLLPSPAVERLAALCGRGDELSYAAGLVS